MALSVHSLYRGLESHFGPNVVQLDIRTRTAYIGMVATDGSPIITGWFHESALRGLPDPDATRDYFALTVVPENAETVHHRIRLTQTNPAAQVRLIEDDFDAYLKGLSPVESVHDNRVLDPLAADQFLRHVVLDAKVMDTTEGRNMRELAQAVSLPVLRECGLEMWAQIDPSFQVNAALLNSFDNP